MEFDSLRFAACLDEVSQVPLERVNLNKDTLIDCVILIQLKEPKILNTFFTKLTLLLRHDVIMTPFFLYCSDLKVSSQND
jgi:hypothetical protein